MGATDRDDIFLAEPGKRLRLGRIPTDCTGVCPSKEEAARRLEPLRARLAALQERLFAEGRRSVLIVLQAMDTGGKDGAVKNIFLGVNPAGVRITSFKAPSAEELAHDFLWRVHRAVPDRGLIAVWNRSHYEDVLVTRVRGLIDRAICARRFDDIVAFERMISNEGVRVLKFYLHISKDEQKRRLQARLDDPAKRWKFDPADLADRAHWDEYMSAYEDIFRFTSTDFAPWRIVPADRKWSRNLALTRALVEALEEMDPRHPPARFDPAEVVLD